MDNHVLVLRNEVHLDRVVSFKGNITNVYRHKNYPELEADTLEKLVDMILSYEANQKKVAEIAEAFKGMSVSDIKGLVDNYKKPINKKTGKKSKVSNDTSDDVKVDEEALDAEIEKSVETDSFDQGQSPFSTTQ